jgi:1-acyl-sn-glycerol-3-phosphate acyltransferase
MTGETIDISKLHATSYNHARLEPQRRILRFLIKVIGFGLLTKLDRVEGIEHVPSRGPAILMINHIAFVDPIVVMHVLPRNIIPLAKVEVYNYPGIGIFPRIWGVIPVKREELDRRAIQQMFAVLNAGEIILVAPEGTRGDALQIGKEGIAYIGSRTQVPIVPVAIQGTRGFPALRFSKPWKGRGAYVRFGRPFHYRPEFKHAGLEKLRHMTDEAMYILASLLPPEQRGYYHDLSQGTMETIEWV